MLTFAKKMKLFHNKQFTLEKEEHHLNHLCQACLDSELK